MVEPLPNSRDARQRSSRLPMGGRTPVRPEPIQEGLKSFLCGSSCEVLA